MRGRHLIALAGLIALAALLRFATLDLQSFWYDEAVTVGLVRRGFGDMLRHIADGESTPPLYYVLAWCWSGPSPSAARPPESPQERPQGA
jgi:hypothetical protein